MPWKYPSGPAWGLLLGVFGLVAVCAGLAPAERDGVLAGLKPGMPVTLSEKAGRFEIGVFPDTPGPLGHEVVALGNDFVAVKDIAGFTETWIPIYSIACVKTTKIPR